MRHIDIWFIHRGKKQSTKTDPEEAQMLDKLDKDTKSAVLNMSELRKPSLKK